MRMRTKAAVAAAVAAGALTLGAPLAAYASSLPDGSSSGSNVEGNGRGTTGSGALIEGWSTNVGNDDLPVSTAWH